MKRLLSFLIILIINSVPTIDAQEYYGPKKKIIVDNFYVNQKKAYLQSAKLFTSKLKSELLNTNRFLIKEAEEIELSKELTQLAIKGTILRCREEAVIKWYDRPLPARWRGQKITHAEIEVEIALCNPNTKIIIKSFRVKEKAKLDGEKLAGFGSGGKSIISNPEGSALSLAINKTMKKVIDIIIKEMDKYKWEAKITRVIQDKIYLDCGLESYIKAGTKLRVYEKNNKPVGEIKIIEVNKDFSIATITENDGIEPDLIVRMME